VSCARFVVHVTYILYTIGQLLIVRDLECGLFHLIFL